MCRLYAETFCGIMLSNGGRESKCKLSFSGALTVWDSGLMSDVAQLLHAHAEVQSEAHCTVSRVLFRKSELTEFCGKLGEFALDQVPRNPVFLKAYFMHWVCGVLPRCFGKSDCHQLGECFAC